MSITVIILLVSILLISVVLIALAAAGVFDPESSVSPTPSPIPCVTYDSLSLVPRSENPTVSGVNVSDAVVEDTTHIFSFVAEFGGIPDVIEYTSDMVDTGSSLLNAVDGVTFFTIEDFTTLGSIAVTRARVTDGGDDTFITWRRSAGDWLTNDNRLPQSANAAIDFANLNVVDIKLVNENTVVILGSVVRGVAPYHLYVTTLGEDNLWTAPIMVVDRTDEAGTTNSSLMVVSTESSRVAVIEVDIVPVGVTFYELDGTEVVTALSSLDATQAYFATTSMIWSPTRSAGKYLMIQSLDFKTATLYEWDTTEYKATTRVFDLTDQEVLIRLGMNGVIDEDNMSLTLASRSTLYSADLFEGPLQPVVTAPLSLESTILVSGGNTSIFWKGTTNWFMAFPILTADVGTPTQLLYVFEATTCV